MRSGDLIDILCIHGDMPISLTGPRGEKLVMTNILPKGDGDQILHIKMGYAKPQEYIDTMYLDNLAEASV